MANNSMFLYGKNSVLERLRADASSVQKIFIQDDFDFARIVKLVRKTSVPVERLSARELSKIRRTGNLQGIAARVSMFKYTPFKDLLDRKGGDRPTIIFLDRIFDPQNLGSIIRTAACFGGFAVVLPKHNACDVNETVLHVASGGENHTPVSMVSNLTNAVLRAKDRGYWIMGAFVSDEAKRLCDIDLPFPLGLVLGSEGEGIREGLKKYVDLEARLPMDGARLSLNVAVACAIFCSDISKVRGQKRSGGTNEAQIQT
ncbi:23S rRNA (guanosine(2251)-2'-O)-methyltransferase RlmB [Candidatus Omnitrophota bacterium]